MNQGRPNGKPYSGFEETSEHLIEALSQQCPMGVWMVTRVSGNDWRVLTVKDRGFGVSKGDVFQWSDSLCSRMVTGKGPIVSPDVSSESAFCLAEITQQLSVGSYLGVPIHRESGELFGTVCAMDKSKRTDALYGMSAPLVTATRMLSTVLNLEVRNDEYQRASERFLLDAEIEPSTGLASRRAWDRCVQFEQSLVTKYGSELGLVMIDVTRPASAPKQPYENAIRLLGLEIRHWLRPIDFVARYNKSRIAILLPEADEMYLSRFSSFAADCGSRIGEKVKVSWALSSSRTHVPDAVAGLASGRAAA